MFRPRENDGKLLACNICSFLNNSSQNVRKPISARENRLPFDIECGKLHMQSEIKKKLRNESRHLSKVVSHNIELKPRSSRNQASHNKHANISTENENYSNMRAENLEKFGEFLKEFYNKLPGVSVICISLLGGDYTKLLGEVLLLPFRFSTWLLITQFDASSQPINIFLPADLISNSISEEPPPCHFEFIGKAISPPARGGAADEIGGRDCERGWEATLAARPEQAGGHLCKGRRSGREAARSRDGGGGRAATGSRCGLGHAGRREAGRAKRRLPRRLCC
ncbi:hypothetical protein KSP39_PZI008971 [Platanthera zijinensis]|uniref:Uncharacterized protein n=1 Tax=Platanthera zijinensis TaxID=2320716 RepID=A0AAP0BLA5_9ASPA